MKTLRILALAALAACGNAEAREVSPPAATTGMSVYNLESEWRDQTGATRRLASLGGKVQVVALVYTHCAYACPLLLADLKRIEGAVGAEGIGFVLVSIDPERDTAERLAAFAQEARLDPARWTLLSAPDDAVLELAALLGVRYRRESAIELSHSNAITVLDRSGEVAHQQEGLGTDPEATLSRIRSLVRPE